MRIDYNHFSLTFPLPEMNHTKQMTNDIITVDYHMVPHSSLDRRHDSNDKVEPVNVSVIENRKVLPHDRHYVPSNVIELVLTFILCSIGAIGLFSYSLSFTHDVLNTSTLDNRTNSNGL